MAKCPPAQLLELLRAEERHAQPGRGADGGRRQRPLAHRRPPAAGHDAGPASAAQRSDRPRDLGARPARSEEHTSELQSLMRISYAVFCLKKKKNKTISTN